MPLYFALRPSIAAKSVDFPAPLGPIMPKKSPWLTVKLTSSIAFTSGYSIVR